MCDIAAQLPHHPGFSSAARALQVFINREVTKARVLGLHNGQRNLEIEFPASEGQYDELVWGWDEPVEATRPEKLRKKYKQDYTGCEETKAAAEKREKKEKKRTRKVNELWLGNPILYVFLQLEAVHKSCAGPAKELDSKDWLVVHRLQAEFTQQELESDTWTLELVKIKVSFAKLHHRSADINNIGGSIPVPSFSFPIFRKAADERRELPVDKRTRAEESALSIPKWAHSQQLCSGNVHRNLQ